MSTEQNKSTARYFVDEAINGGMYDVLPGLVAPTCVIVGAAATGSGPEVFRRVFAAIREGFPDYRMHIEEMIAEGDTVVLRVRESGTHQGRFMGMEATGRRASWSGVNFLRFEDGMLVQSWGLRDRLEMMQQLTADRESGGPSPAS